MKICTVQEMRQMDRHAIETMGIPEDILMENAGQASASVLAKDAPIRGRRFVVFCGVGNNGGDGFVLARLLHSRGGQVKVYIAGDANLARGATQRNLQILSKLPVTAEPLKSARKIRTEVAHSHVLVDALFGTGLDRPVGGLQRDLIELMNSSGKTILSLDIPSGVNGDTGEVLGTAVHAHYTVAFGLPKTGNMLYPGFSLCGRLYVSHISFPPALYDSDTLKVQTNGSIKLPPRDPNAHKGNVGDVLIIAGAAHYYGAPYFAGQSFLRAGGGYARLAVPAPLVATLALKGSEIVFFPQAETASGGMGLANKTALLELAEKVDFVVLGPGLSLGEETRQLVQEIVPLIKKPLLIDGDGITAMTPALKGIRKRKAATILTPHPGEMARLTGKTVGEIEKSRIDTLQKASRDLGSAIVLKGAHSLIGYPDGRVFVNLSGNAGMATAGSGDVLTGTIAAMHGLGLPVSEAVRKGVFLHGVAGDIAARHIGADGMTAGDILDHLPQALQMDREGLDGDQRQIYDGPPVI